MTSPRAPSHENEALVAGFFADMGETYEQMRAAFERHMADDCVWANQGFSEVRGKARILEFLHDFVERIGLRSVGGQVINIASAGDIVLTERHERWTGDGGVVLIESLPVMGAFELADGKIRAWRDYFDPGLLAHLSPPENEEAEDAAGPAG